MAAVELVASVQKYVLQVFDLLITSIENRSWSSAKLIKTVEQLSSPLINLYENIS